MTEPKHNIEKLIHEYPLDYCQSLEAVYGKGMMSEGGEDAILSLMGGINPTGLKILDFGCGLGGVSHFLAKTYDCDVTGIDINEKMIKAANTYNEQEAFSFKGEARFICLPPCSALPFESTSFDIILTKGVLTHIHYKLPLFLEYFRLLKPSGYLLIDDWLSPKTNHWGTHVKSMIEIEGLSLYALSHVDYLILLKSAGFECCSRENVSLKYCTWNQDIVDMLLSEKKSQPFIQQFGDVLHQEYITSYQAITEAMRSGELEVHTFRLKKPIIKT